MKSKPGKDTYQVPLSGTKARKAERVPPPAKPKGPLKHDPTHDWPYLRDKYQMIRIYKHSHAQLRVLAEEYDMSMVQVIDMLILAQFEEE